MNEKVRTTRMVELTASPPAGIGAGGPSPAHETRSGKETTMHRTPHSLRGHLAAGIGGLGSLLALLAASPPAHAITYLTVDNHPAPVTLLAGENLVIRL
jgi:hypothetical protein